jgi:hypothetical protein
MSSPSDAEVIGRSLGEPEAFGLIYDRHAATVLRFLGRCGNGLLRRPASESGRLCHGDGAKAGATAAEGVHGVYAPNGLGHASRAGRNRGPDRRSGRVRLGGR